MPDEKRQKRRKPHARPLSLHPLTFEQAVDRILLAKQKPKKKTRRTA
jgi:hypothetical protein